MELEGFHIQLDVEVFDVLNLTLNKASCKGQRSQVKYTGVYTMRVEDHSLSYGINNSMTAECLVGFKIALTEILNLHFIINNSIDRASMGLSEILRTA